MAIDFKANFQPIILQELGLPRSKVRLAQMDMPEPNVSVGSEHRSSQTWLAGQDVATTHQLGMRFDPITLRGRFHDDLLRILGQSPQDLVRAIRGIQTRGNPVRLKWGNIINRVGRIKRFVPEYVRADDIKYELTFEVDEVLEPGSYFYETPPLVAIAQTARDVINIAIAAAAIAKTTIEATQNTVNSAKR